MCVPIEVSSILTEMFFGGSSTRRTNPRPKFSALEMWPQDDVQRGNQFEGSVACTENPQEPYF